MAARTITTYQGCKANRAMTNLTIIETDEFMVQMAKSIRNIVRDEVTRAIKANRPASYSRPEAAKLLGITTSTLTKKIDTQCIRTSADGTRISTQEIDRYLNA